MSVNIQKMRRELDTGSKSKYSLQGELTHFFNNQPQRVRQALGQSNWRIATF